MDFAREIGYSPGGPKIAQNLSAIRFVLDSALVRLGMAWPALSRFGSSLAQLSSARQCRHGLAQYGSQLLLAGLGLVQVALASAVQ